MIFGDPVPMPKVVDPVWGASKPGYRTGVVLIEKPSESVLIAIRRVLNAVEPDQRVSLHVATIRAWLKEVAA